MSRLLPLPLAIVLAIVVLAALRNRSVAERRRIFLRAHAVMGLFGVFMLIVELGTHFLGWSVVPFAVFHGNPLLILMGLEAHGLALIMAATFLLIARDPQPPRAFSMTAALAGILCGCCNTLFWNEAFTA